jgi:hypothetical protein
VNGERRVVTTRELHPDDWAEWRAIRLAALGTDPDAFGSRYANWAYADESRWRARIADVELTLLLERDATPVGVVCVSR